MPKQLTNQILAPVQSLPQDQQHRVLEFARALNMSKPVGVSWEVVLRFAGSVDKDDLGEMAKAIEDGCERIDPDGW